MPPSSNSPILEALLKRSHDWWIQIWTNSIHFLNDFANISCRIPRILYNTASEWWTWLRFGKGLSGTFRGGLFQRTSERGQLLAELKTQARVLQDSMHTPEKVLRFTSLLLSYLSEYISEGLEPVEEIRSRWQFALESQMRPSFLATALPSVFGYPSRADCASGLAAVDKLSSGYFLMMGRIERLHQDVLRALKSSNENDAMSRKHHEYLQRAVRIAKLLHKSHPVSEKSKLSLGVEAADECDKIMKLSKWSAVGDAAILELLDTMGKSYQEPSLDLAQRPELVLRQFQDLWWVNAIVKASLLFASVYWIRENQHNIGVWWTSILEWLQLHLVDPSSTILREIFLEEGLHIVDPETVIETKTSLQHMVQHYLESRAVPQGLATLEDANRMASQLDMSILVDQYEKGVRSPIRGFIVGDMMQLGLIQAQVLKHEMMVAMVAVDKIMQENHFNAQLMAMIPAFVVFSGVYVTLRQMWWWFVDDSLSTTVMSQNARVYLSRIERQIAVVTRGKPNSWEQMEQVGKLTYLLLSLEDLVSKSYRMTSTKERVEIRKHLEMCYHRHGLAEEGNEAVKRLRNVHSMFQASL